MKKKRSILLAAAGFLILAGVIYVACAANRLFGSARVRQVAVAPGNFHPARGAPIRWHDDSRVREQLLEYWASKPLGDWKKRAKVEDPRIILACLFLNKRVEEVNHFLARQVPESVIGSTWLLNHHGDYDFTLMGLTPLLYFFGDKPGLLYPGTRDHLLKVLLNVQGGRFISKVPRSLGLIEDTENHLLMINGSGYLKNRWLWLHGHRDAVFDNQRNGLERKLLDDLLELYDNGIYEFNANPYEGYTLSALLNLEAFATDSVRLMAGRLLDRLNWEYAVGSFHFNSYPPFRRRYSRAARTSLDGDYQSAMMKTWISFYDDSLPLKITRGQHQALWAAVMPYRPDAGVIDLVLHKTAPYFIRIGHGWNSCPEIYSGDSCGLFSAGGANRGSRSFIVARPVLFITSDSAEDLRDVFHMAGPGTDFREWNNTGVYQDFACAAGPVSIPPGRIPVASGGGWKIFDITRNRYLAVYSTRSLGLMALCTADTPEGLLRQLQGENPVSGALRTHFRHPDGDLIEYDLKAPHDRWVITSVNHQRPDRMFDHWPLYTVTGFPGGKTPGVTGPKN